MITETKYDRPAQNHEGYTVTLTAPDGTVLGTEEIVFSDGTYPDGKAGSLYCQNGESYGVIEVLVGMADKHINGGGA